MAVVSELVTRFSFIGSLKPQADFNSNLGKGLGLLAKFSGAIVAGASAMFAWNTSVLAGLDPMIQLSRETGVAIDKLQELGYVASVNGSNAGALQASISALSKTIGDAARWTGPGIEGFQRLGISIRDTNGQLKTADVIMMEMQRQFKALNLSTLEQRSIAQSLGIDPSLIQMMGLTSDRMSELQRKARSLGVINKEQADDADAFNSSLTTLRFGMSGISNMIAVGFAPQMRRLTDSFVSFLEANQDLIINGLRFLGEFMNSFIGLLDRTMPLIFGIIAAFALWKISAIGLGGVLAAAFAPVYLITAAIVALILIIDDLVTAFRGGESVIANFFKQFDIDIGQILRDIDEIFAPANIAKNFFIATGMIKTAFVDAFDFVSDQFFSLGDKITQLWTNVIASIKAMAVDILPAWAVDLLRTSASVAGSVVDAGAGFLNYIGEGLDSVRGVLNNTLPQSQTVGGGVQNTTSSTTIQQDIDFIVQATDPQATANAIADKLQRQQEEAQAQFRRGGR